jgi:signal transduction histidine kinase
LASLRTQIEVAVAHPAGVDLVVIGPELLADVDRLERLASDLLELARLDNTTVEHTPIDIREVVSDELAATTSRSIRYQTDGPTEPVIVRGDRRQLQRMLRNLLDNADRYAASTIQVCLRDAGDHALLEVIDDGPGIAVEDRLKIFERFTRLDDARATEHGGAGLGLAIVNEIIRAHHGSIHVNDRQAGHGARFTIELPR